MGKYKINYKTGNSLHQHNTHDYVELLWDNLKIARENLKAIAMHYLMYNEIEYQYDLNDKYNILSKYQNYWWFVKGDRYTDSQHCMKLKADNGNLMQQSNFWCGYFEHLHGAEIELDSNDIKILT